MNNMNPCCKLTLQKAMQNQRDVAITTTMALVMLEALWQSQWTIANAAENTVCAYGCGDRYHDFVEHAPDCKFVQAWNGEELLYLRYSFDFDANHELKVKR